jgi:uncharacterized protein YggL (DUF469 family)
MKKRLRKKRHLKEFSEFGFGFECEWKDSNLESLSDSQEAILYSFVDFCELNGWDCGGGGDTKTFGMVVTKYKHTIKSQKQANDSVTLEERDKVFDWLINTNIFKSIKITDLVDMWNAGDKIYDNPIYTKMWNVNENSKT